MLCIMMKSLTHLLSMLCIMMKSLTHLLSMLCIMMKSFHMAVPKQKTKRLTGFRFRTFLGRFQVIYHGSKGVKAYAF